VALSVGAGHVEFEGLVLEHVCNQIAQDFVVTVKLILPRLLDAPLGANKQG